MYERILTNEIQNIIQETLTEETYAFHWEQFMTGLIFTVRKLRTNKNLAKDIIINVYIDFEKAQALWRRQIFG
jgi:hypothetical protein